MKTLLISLMIQSTITCSALFAGEAVQMPTTEVKALNMQLDFMELTPAEIKKRDKILAPIYENYTTVNLSSVVNALEKSYGMNVYHHMFEKTLTLKDKKSVMENAVRYYSGGASLFDQAAPGILLYKGSVSIRNKVADHNTYWNGTAQVSYSYTEPTVTMDLVEGNEDKFNTTITEKSPSLLTSYEATRRIEDFIFRSKIGERKALFTSTQKPLYTAPVLSNFLEAMKELNLKALDASVVFASADMETKNKSQIVYPNFSKLAPIPQPVLYIGKDATTEDIKETLREHAPKIYAYNKLFNANLLPSVSEINEVLTKYPNILAEVEKKVGKVKRENVVNAIQAAFLNVTYGTGVLLATPIALSAMAASAVFSPILIATVVVVII